MDEEKNEDERMEKLNQILEFYHNEVERCQKTEAFFAGCILLGAELECLLLGMVECYPDEVRECPLSPQKKPPSRWSLFDLLQIAKYIGWLPSSLSLNDEFDAEKAEVGDYTEVVRELRNLVHPGRWIRDYLDVEIEKEHFELSFEVLQAVRDWLFARLVDSINEEIEKQEKNP